ncbi:GrdX family protein [Clostridium sp. C105KSO13]|uniref:GrdX family protein n=1 Tax=Clostridium sp. C105KSO13 TaxID=1776045 RepID=UPI0007405AD4|nr:GrdX family protein [Clostridium sp. C105KSO13]CUX38104.1 hypothetical protein BN3456_01878 [Clostridium sp. C105KSO13]
MARENFEIITNNPLVLGKLEKTHYVAYHEISYEEILKKVRDRIHEGHRLLSHPLSGSVKPKETPYKSIIITKRKEMKPDLESLELIENAIEACGKFSFKADLYGAEVYKDFQLIDWTLLKSALESAEI